MCHTALQGINHLRWDMYPALVLLGHGLLSVRGDILVVICVHQPLPNPPPNLWPGKCTRALLGDHGDDLLLLEGKASCTSSASQGLCIGSTAAWCVASLPSTDMQATDLNCDGIPNECKAGSLP
jgi:hypothetical protein